MEEIAEKLIEVSERAQERVRLKRWGVRHDNRAECIGCRCPLPVAIAKVPLCHGQDIKSIQCSEALHPEFTRFVLKFHEGRLLNLARGANTEGLNLAMLEELPVPTVPPSEQKHFAELVKCHERLRAVQGEALRQAEHRFASFLDRGFRDQ